MISASTKIPGVIFVLLLLPMVTFAVVDSDFFNFLNIIKKLNTVIGFILFRFNKQKNLNPTEMRLSLKKISDSLSSKFYSLPPGYVILPSSS
ncbi:hypothetical protein DRF65_04535 [Chryseobacterium pennae]|uniref:Uncharacterized protein n=1 Tax=Chryseobacterium pennae TaxID=2258962 RepID=A0A3D9CDH6_9FLAO|nr:hypothetical protein DRF65_04535 [Chryseobacterium pennae]